MKDTKKNFLTYDEFETATTKIGSRDGFLSKDFDERIGDPLVYCLPGLMAYRANKQDDEGRKKKLPDGSRYFGRGKADHLRKFEFQHWDASGKFLIPASVSREKIQTVDGTKQQYDPCFSRVV